MIDESIIIKSNGVINSAGALKLYNQQQFLEIIAANACTNVEIVIQKHKGISHPLRSYYFKIIVTELQKAFYNVGYDYTKDDVDYLMREKFLYYEQYSETLDRYIKHRHTLRAGETQVTRKMFLEYIQQCIRFGAMYLNWAIPQINENLSSSDITEEQANYYFKH